MGLGAPVGRSRPKLVETHGRKRWAFSEHKAPRWTHRTWNIATLRKTSRKERAWTATRIHTPYPTSNLHANRYSKASGTGGTWTETPGMSEDSYFQKKPFYFHDFMFYINDSLNRTPLNYTDISTNLHTHISFLEKVLNLFGKISAVSAEGKRAN